MTELARKVGDEKLSVRKTEELVREMLANPGDTPTPLPEREAATPDEFHEASRLIREALELPVRVKSLRSGGKVEIRFREPQELEALVSLLTSQNETETKTLNTQLAYVNTKRPGHVRFSQYGVVQTALV